jgi:hypothetical protein
MPTASSAAEPKRHSRRSFLAKLTVGMAILTASVSPLARLATSGKKGTLASSQDLPGPDSIFHPAKDPRKDPRRKTLS